MEELIIKAYQASYGESFLVSINNEMEFNIIIDFGFKTTYNNIIKNDINSLAKKNKKLNLIILTHIDIDHIVGFIPFIKDMVNHNLIGVDDIWFNNFEHVYKSVISKPITREYKTEIIEEIKCSTHMNTVDSYEEEIGYKEAETISGLIEQYSLKKLLNKKNNNKAIYLKENESFREISLSKDIKIVLLSPYKKDLIELLKNWHTFLMENNYKNELHINNDMIKAFEAYHLNKEKLDHFNYDDTQSFDKSLINRSSIAFILHTKDKNVLFLADSHHDTIYNSISEYLKYKKKTKLRLDLVKVSHHGSKNNISDKLLELLESSRYLICTNGAIFNHPDFECLKKIITKQSSFKTIYFNYPLNNNTLEYLNNFDRSKYNYNLIINNEDEPCLAIEL